MNEPAFPCQEILPDGMANLTPQRGMTLRDYFAAQALATFVDPHAWQSTVGKISREVAFNAYALADAMMEAREA